MIHACIRPPSGVKVSKIMTDFSHSLTDAANPAMALWLTIEDQWRRVADLER
jgi:hypothetical protein